MRDTKGHLPSTDMGELSGMGSWTVRGVAGMSLQQRSASFSKAPVQRSPLQTCASQLLINATQFIVFGM